MPKLWKSLALAVLLGSTGVATALADPGTSRQQSGQPVAQAGEAAILRSLQARSASPRPAGFGIGNYASVVQSGDFNRSTIVQSGSANVAETRILNGSYNETMQTQTGSRNVSRVEIANGRNNKAKTTQTGDDNTINLVLRDAENTTVEFTQTGNGLNSSQSPISIERTGSSPMPIIIHQSNR